MSNELPRLQSMEKSLVHIPRITPSVMTIDLSFNDIAEAMKKLKVNKACGPDDVAPLKSCGDALIPSLLSLFSISASSNVVQVHGSLLESLHCLRKMT